MTSIKYAAQMVFELSDYTALKAANSAMLTPTAQTNEYKGLTLKCPISVEKGTGGDGYISGDTGDGAVVSGAILHEHRIQFIKPQREFNFGYHKLDRALMLENGSFLKTSYSRIVIAKDEDVLSNLLDRFIASINKKRIHRNKYSIAMDMILANIIQTFRSERLLIISRHNGSPKNNNPSNIDNRIIVELCDWLCDEGYVELGIQPSQRPSNDKTARSFLRASDKLMRLVYNYRIIQSGDHLVIRNDKKEEISIPKDKAVLLKVKAYREVLEDYFKLTAHFLFTLDGAEFPVHGRRIFNRTIDLGGRFYSDYQNGLKGNRKRIKIDNEKTVEYDYGSLHYNFLYSMVGIQLKSGKKNDPYIVEGYERKSIKAVSLRLLNVKNPRSLSELSRMITLSGTAKQIKEAAEYDDAIGDYNDIIELGYKADAPYKPKNVKYHIRGIPEGTDGKQLIDNLLARHEPIREYLGSKDIGLKLQNMDSNIMKDVMRTATSEGIPLLFIHDSSICKYTDRARVKEIMINVYKNVTGFKIKVTQKR